MSDLGNVKTKLTFEGNLVVSATFLSLMEAITPGGAFALYGVVCVLGYLFCYFVRDLSNQTLPFAHATLTVPTRDGVSDDGTDIRAVYRVSDLAIRRDRISLASPSSDFGIGKWEVLRAARLVGEGMEEDDR